MNLKELMGQMRETPGQLRALTAGLDDEQVRWKPDGLAWAIVEIVGHMLDEERVDFRPRVLSTLEDPDRRWEPIDPEGAVVERGFLDHAVCELLDEFEAERVASLGLLATLAEPDWSRAYEHPQMGRLAAGDLMLAWAAHDVLHQRQILERRFGLARRAAPGYETRYAGLWSGG